MDIAADLAQINSIHQGTFTLAGRFAGGYAEGAYRIIDAHGRPAVLKFNYAPRAIPLIQQLRTLGYPTPAIMHAGMLGNGTQYIVQELLPGVPLTRLTLALATQLSDWIDVQGQQNPTPEANREQSWSHYAHAVVFDDASGWTTQIRNYAPATTALLAALQHAAAPLYGTTLPNTDIVHGDLNVENVLAESGQLTGIIDMLYAGYGTRAIDLATLLHFGYVHRAGQDVQCVLWQRIVALVGQAGLRLCLTYRIIAMLAWAIDHDQAAVDHYVQCGWQIVRDLAQ